MRLTFRLEIIHMDGVKDMSFVAGVLVCAFVYVIRASLVHSGEEDWRSY
ncbi:hypothetical protein [Paenibacillus shirakamiensis]|nr:hypothetical protein [Paenibacillus shirakamiensis]